jgi:predicted DNA binding CopG/RHH family protein
MVKDELFMELSCEKDKRINIRVSERYLNKLNDIKKRTGINLSEMVRRSLIIYINKYDI